MMPNKFSNNMDNKKRQIDSLKKNIQNVIEIIESEEFVTFFTSANRFITMTITLGDGFPKDKPTISVFPALQHAWCSANGNVENAPMILDYTPHSDLGHIVQAVIREFRRSSPSFLHSIDISNEAASSPCSLESHLKASKLLLDDLNKLYSSSKIKENFIGDTSVLLALNEEQLDEISLNLNSCITTLKCLGEQFEKIKERYDKLFKEFLQKCIEEPSQIASSNADGDEKKTTSTSEGTQTG